MSTKTIDRIVFNKKEYEGYKKERNEDKVNYLNKISEDLDKNLLILSEKDQGILFVEGEDLFYDCILNSFFPIFSKYKGVNLRYDDDKKRALNRLNIHHQGVEWEIASLEEIKSLLSLNNKNIVDDKGRIVQLNGNRVSSIGYIMENQLKRYSVGDKKSYPIRESSNNSRMIPIYRASKVTKSKSLLYNFLILGFIPKGLVNTRDFLTLQRIVYELNIKDLNFSKVDKAVIEKLYIEGYGEEENGISNDLLLVDKKRANIKEYDSKMMADLNRGHWDLWKELKDEKHEVLLKTPLVARDPRTDIVDGIIGIDFGTKSTVVVRQKDGFHTLPMRVGIGDYSKEETKHYENPTIMEFIDYKNFKKTYDARKGRPETKWEDLVVSHSALNSLEEATSSEYYSYFGELKQWCGNKEKLVKISDKKGYIEELPAFLNIEDGMNPIEIYAYYLGLYINNMHNGIYLKYYLSFPVTYEVEVRNKIIDSFEKGLKKSLPVTVLEDDEIMKSFEVNKGASEPAAYAITALKEYGFEPEDDEKDFYGVFDFGGGTTDFDFGIWRGTQGAKERRFDYAIEHFGSGGDRYLGGENLLELLTFEVFKNNKDVLREKNISFSLPVEGREFAGSEVLISDSREANLNTKMLVKELRPLWEKHDGYEKKFKDDELKVDLWKQDGEALKKVELSCSIEELEKLIRKRIDTGVSRFFDSIRLAFVDKKLDLNDIEKINIFLAGNSSKAVVVREIFDEYVKKVSGDMGREDIFDIYPPLGSEEAYEMQEVRGKKVDRNALENPTGKTGVAFGLISSRKGSKIKVVDHNIQEDIAFKYHVGEERRDKFKTIIPRCTEYNNWIEFIDAGEEDFEVLYSENPLASTNKVEISDVSIKKKALKVDRVDEDALVYIRTVSPTAIEYVVAYEKGIERQEYLGEVNRIELG